MWRGGKAGTQNQSPVSHSLPKVRALPLISQEGKQPTEQGKLAGVTEKYLLKEWDRWAAGGLKGEYWGGAGRLQNHKLGQKLGWTGTTRYPRATGVERAPAGTRLHRSLETNTTCSGGCVSSSIVSAPGQTHWEGPEGTRVWG